MSLPPIRSWLYAPGNNPKLLERVFTAGADAVILDLEDAVPPSEKLRARAMVSETVRERAGSVGPAVFVRINHPDSGLAQADAEAMVGPGLDGMRIPKVESAETVRLVESWTGGSVPLACTIESALGVLMAREIAYASPRVMALAFGAADFLRDVGGTATADAFETLYARSHLVLAARAGGIRPPVEGVYTRLDDDVGLAHTTRQSHAFGFFGRSALHPRQVPIINAVFTPSDEDIERAREVIERAAVAETTGRGALRLPNGDFVDVAIVQRAQAMLDLAQVLANVAAARPPDTV